MSTKEKLLDLLQFSQAQEDEFAAGLSEQERTRPGQSDNWSTRDVWAHVVEWKLITGRKMAPSEIENVTLLYEGGLHEINEAIFQHLKDRSWEELEELRQEGNRLLRENLAALSAEQIEDPSAFPWLEGRPLWQHVAHNAYQHSLQHMAELFLEKDNYPEAERLMVAGSQGMLSLAKDPATLASFPYNLACFLALNGQTDKAIDQLLLVLPARPDLLEWSKQDSDLDSIRQDARYLALIAG